MEQSAACQRKVKSVPLSKRGEELCKMMSSEIALDSEMPQDGISQNDISDVDKCEEMK